MRAIITADWHIRATRPRCRTDEDWMKTQENALNQIVEISKKKDCDVFCVGDLFNSNSDTSFECIKIVQNMGLNIFNNNNFLGVLAGNHDLPYHSSENINKSAIGVLIDFNIISPIQMITDNYDEWANISAGNFDEPTENKEIIFKHVLTFPDSKSMPPNVDAMTAKDLLEEYDNAKWIFTGDYHHNFHYEKNGRHVVNPGCLLRQVSDMKDYQCGVYFVDTDENFVEFIPIIDEADLIDDSYILKENEREERIENFVNKLKDTKNVSLDYLANVEESLRENKLSPDIVEIIEELLEV